MSKVGFIGLGVMGRHMASNLLKVGYQLVVYNRTTERTFAFVEQGALSADSPADVSSQCSTVITCVADDRAVDDVVFREFGILAGVNSASLVIDMSTVSPLTATRIAEACARAGASFLDAPVSGGEAGAEAGSLSIMVGGSAEAFEKARPLFEVLGETIAHVGPSGSGQSVKAANQLLVAGTIALVSEALTLLRSQEVDMDQALRVLNGGLAGNEVLRRKATAMLASDFDPGFLVRLQRKDLSIVQSLAREANIPLLITSVVTELFTALIASDLSDRDHGALVTVIQRLSGQG